MEHFGRINVSSRNRSFCVERACDCGKRVCGACGIVGGEGAVRRSGDEAVGLTVGVIVVSGDLATQVDVARESALAGARASARRGQSGEFLERRSSREAMRHAIRINVKPYNHSERVDAETD